MGIEAVVSSIEQIMERTIDSQSTPNEELLSKIKTDITQLFTQMKGKLTETSELVRQFLSEDSEYMNTANLLKKNHDEFMLKYKLAKEKSTVHEATVKELGQLEAQQLAVRARIQRVRGDLTNIGNPETLFSQLHQQWFEITEQRTQLLEEQCSVLTDHQPIIH